MNMITKFQHHPHAKYQLAHRQKIKKFFALDFHQVIDETAKVSKVDKLPKIGAHDLVLAIFQGS